MATGGVPEGFIEPVSECTWTARLGGQEVDFQRFAYDVLAFSAEKFGFHIACIYQTRLPRNDYGREDFLLVISREIFRLQINHRKRWNNLFNSVISIEHFGSPEHIEMIKSLWTNLLNKDKICTCMQRVLAFTNELSLYLYSRNFIFYLDSFVAIWSAWLYDHKAKFLEAGGLDFMYYSCLRSEYHCDDDVNRYFIPSRCIPYKESINNPFLYDEWLYVLRNFRKIAKSNGIPPPTTACGQPDSRSDVDSSVKSAWYRVVEHFFKEVARVYEPEPIRRRSSSLPPGLDRTLQRRGLRASEGEESNEGEPSDLAKQQRSLVEAVDVEGRMDSDSLEDVDSSEDEAASDEETSSSSSSDLETVIERIGLRASEGEESNEDESNDLAKQQGSLVEAEEQAKTIEEQTNSDSCDDVDSIEDELIDIAEQPRGSFVEAEKQAKNIEERTNSDSSDDVDSIEDELVDIPKQPQGSFVEAEEQAKHIEQTNSDSWEDVDSSEDEQSVSGPRKAKSTQKKKSRSKSNKRKK